MALPRKHLTVAGRKLRKLRKGTKRSSLFDRGSESGAGSSGLLGFRVSARMKEERKSFRRERL